MQLEAVGCGDPEVVESLGAARVDAVMFGAATEFCAEQ